MIDDAIREFVWQRANGRCEYCQLHHTEYSYQIFHVEHIIAKQHGGSDVAENLCLACAECNWAKGPNLGGLFEGRLFPLFHPRRQSWNRHFRWDRTTLVGKTKSGIVTVQVLDMNKASRIMLRENLLFEGHFPPID
jgi:5-methylcytosine-specific restriction endonuclease McrA